jgi:hypothetical protein
LPPTGPRIQLGPLVGARETGQALGLRPFLLGAHRRPNVGLPFLAVFVLDAGGVHGLCLSLHCGGRSLAPLR